MRHKLYHLVPNIAISTQLRKIQLIELSFNKMFPRPPTRLSQFDFNPQKSLNKSSIYSFLAWKAGILEYYVIIKHFPEILVVIVVVLAARVSVEATDGINPFGS